MKSLIMAILVDERCDAATKVQEVLTKAGCIIETRLGIHESDGGKDEGLIILKLNGTTEEVTELKQELNEIDRVKADIMQLDLS